MLLNLTRDRNAVCFVAKMNHGEQKHEFEFSEVPSLTHLFNNSEETVQVNCIPTMARKCVRELRRCTHSNQEHRVEALNESDHAQSPRITPRKRARLQD